MSAAAVVEGTVTVGAADVVEQVLRICSALLGAASEAWRSTSPDDFEVRRIHGGITNVLFKVAPRSTSPVPPSPPSVLVRAFGAGNKVCDRVHENRLVRDLSDAGFGPEILGVFSNGRLEAWLEGHRTLEPDEMLQTGPVDFVSLSARKLGEMHARILPAAIADKAKVPLWTQLRVWAALAEQVAFPSDERKAAKLAQLDLPAVIRELDHCESLLPSGLNSEGEELIARAGAPGSVAQNARRLLYEKRFCHLDLLAQNIMFSEELGEVRFIDFEYSAMCYVGVDIANHFNAVPESCLVHEPQVFDPDKYYPRPELQLHWLRAYLEARSIEADAELLAEMLRVIAEFALVAELRWVIWAVVQAGGSPVDFDYLGYGNMRFHEGYGRYRRWLESGSRA